MHITIECLSGSLAGKVFSFDQDEIGLGRGENQKKDIDFADTDIGVSRNHALISIRAQRVFLVDQSRGGTLARGQRIQGTTLELRSGEELQLGGPSGPRLRVRFRAMTQIEPPRGETGFFEPLPAAQEPAVQAALPAQPLPPVAPPPEPGQPLVALASPPVGTPLPPGPAIPAPFDAPVPTPRPGPAPVQNSETLIQPRPELAPPVRPVFNQETMLQVPAASTVPVPGAPVPPPVPPAPPLKPVSPQSNTVVQMPPTPPRPGVRETNAASSTWSDNVQAPAAPAYSSEATPPAGNLETYVQNQSPADNYGQAQPGRPYQASPQAGAEDATYFQAEAPHQVPRPNNRPSPTGPNGGQTILQVPAPTSDTNPTLLQEDNHFPWLPFSLVGLAAVTLLGIIWVFLLHQPIYFFLPLPIVLVLGLGAFFFLRR